MYSYMCTHICVLIYEYPYMSTHISLHIYWFTYIIHSYDRIRQRMWDHVPEVYWDRAVDKEKRARYDVIRYDSILCHANTTVDPSTGHMLQTIQMI